MNKLRTAYRLTVFGTGLLTALSVSGVYADSALNGGKAETGVWFERQTSADKSQRNDYLTFAPALSYDRGAVSKIEMLLTTQRDTNSSTGTDTYSQLNAAGIRVRKDVELVDHWGMFFRGLVGHTLGDTSRYWYGYSDAALTYRVGLADLMLGVRVNRALDGASGQDFNKLLLGPVFHIGTKHSIEINWIRSWQATSNTLDSNSAMVEYIYKF
jgi:hypothetical protein